MKMQDAFWLANHIEANVVGIRVTAVGTFVPLHLLEDDTPWKVLVHANVLDKPAVVTSEADLRSVVEMVQAKQPKLEGMLF